MLPTSMGMEERQPQTVAILGANGFVGSHLVDAMSVLPDVEVIAFDRFSREPAYVPAGNIRQVRGDYFAAGEVEAALEDADYVIHCFSSTNPSVSDGRPLADVELLHRTVEIFEAVAAGPAKRLVYMSSGGAVYGESEHPSREDDPLRPISPYGIGKLAIEQYLAYFERKKGLDSVSFRLTNPYGPRQEFKNGQGVIPLFINKIKQGEPLMLMGDGSASRDYIFVEDAAAMVAATFRGAYEHPVYNLGSGEQTSLTTLVDTLGRLLGREVAIEYKPAPATFVQRTDIDMSRYWGEFGKPEPMPLDEGIKRMLNG